MSISSEKSPVSPACTSKDPEISPSLRQTRSSLEYLNELPPQNTEKPSKSHPNQPLFPDDEVAEAIAKYLGYDKLEQRVADLMVQSGLFDIMVNGMARIVLEQVPELEQKDFIKDYLLLRNWNREEMTELEEEFADWNTDLDILKEENKQLRAECLEMGMNLDDLRLERFKPIDFD